jgi:DNA-binding NarL/FixJ family response regulator
VISSNNRTCKNYKARSENYQNVICSLWCEGMTIKQIAGLLKLSTKTIEYHWTRFRQRIGIWHEASITRWAIKQGFTLD